MVNTKAELNMYFDMIDRRVPIRTLDPFTGCASRPHLALV